MFCQNCGGTLPDDAAACPKCGTLQPSGTPQVEDRALTSLVLGILGLFFSIFAAIPAVIVGHKSYSQIRKSPNTLSGEGIALAGMILGYIGIALCPIVLMVAIPRFTDSRRAAYESAAAANVRTLITKQASYFTTYPTAGYAPDLVTLGPGTGDCQPSPSQKNACMIDKELGCAGGTSGQWCIKDEYKYSIVGVKQGGSGVPTSFIITATPANSRSGRKNFCGLFDGIVRFREGPPLDKPLASVDDCEKWEQL